MNRASYRRQLKEDEKYIARGVDAGRRDGYQIIAMMRVLRDKLRVCIERRSVTSLMYFLYSNMTAGSRYIADVPIACGRGCSHCCHIWVDAMAPEIFHAANAILPKQRTMTSSAIDAACSVTTGVTFEQRGEMVTRCPLLIDDLCSVYDARPNVCRTAVSADADICRRSYFEVSGEDIPIPMIWNIFRQGYGIALESALHNAGLAHQASEWNQSLRMVVNDDTLEARWLGGEDVFSTVSRATAGTTLNHPLWREMYHEAFGVNP